MISLQLSREAGFCSLLSSIFSHLYAMPAGAAVHIFARSTYYSHEAENMFDWFFDQSPLRDPTEIWGHGCNADAVKRALNVDFAASTTNVNIAGHNFDTYPANTHLARDFSRLEQLRSFARTYLKPKPDHIELARKIVGSGRRLGIHFRGTDKRYETPRVEPQQVLEIYRKLPGHDSVFLATDEQRAADFFRESIPNLVLNQHVRCDGDVGLHVQRGNPRQSIETMIDVYCLGMCDTLLLGRGNCGDMALVFGTPQSVEYYN